MKSSESSDTFPVALFFLCFEGILCFVASFTVVVALILYLNSHFFRRLELCWVMSEDICVLIEFGGNHKNVANHLYGTCLDDSPCRLLRHSK